MEIYHAEPFGFDDLSITEYLEYSLNELSTLEPSTGSFDLSLSDVCITPTVISLLLQILNHTLPREHTQNRDDSKWDFVGLTHCYFALPTSVAQSTDTRYCTQEDLHTFFSTLLTRTKALRLYNASGRTQALDFFLQCPLLEQMELTSLRIDEGSQHTFDYVRLGNIIQRSTHLTELNLSLPYGNVPHEMFESLSNAINLQRLCLRAFWNDENDQILAHLVGDEFVSGAVARLLQNSQSENDRILSHLVGDEGVSGAVARLLQNPQSRLQQLELRRMRLKDCHFSAIVRLLPTSNLKLLDVSYNQIQSRGILEFAEQLPRIQSLKTMILLPNPWLPASGECSDVEAADECGAALVQGMMKNYSVEQLKKDYYDPSEFEENSQTKLMTHLADLNRAGRHILAVSTSVPLGLWPYVLERAGTTISYRSCDYEASPRDEAEAAIYPPFRVARKRADEEQAERKVNAVFFLLRNSPIFIDKRDFTKSDAMN